MAVNKAICRKEEKVMIQKKILITGKTSYIGRSFQKYIEIYNQKNPEMRYEVDAISVRGEEWKQYDFSKYDVVLHLAGIAHVDIRKGNQKELQEKYYRVNRDLTIEIANKAKLSGIEQFIFMSSIIVYGDSAPIGKQKIITKDTIPSPSNFYGDSKLQAEKGIQQLEDDTFKVVIIRPPMIYGKGCKGNYAKLEKLARITPVFPKIDNQRSMLDIKHLDQYILNIIKKEKRGTFFPQEKEFVNVSKLVQELGQEKGRNVWLVPGFQWLFMILGRNQGQIGVITNKVFGNLIYEKEIKNMEK